MPYKDPAAKRANRIEWREKNRARLLAYENARRAANRDREQANKLRQRYGITPEQRDVLFAKGCGICGVTCEKLVIDHNHVTGEIRGALCYTHNTALGLFDDNPFLLDSAQDYLYKNLCEPVLAESR